MPQLVEIATDTTVRLRFQWPVAETTLLLTRLGRPYWGPARVAVDAEGAEGASPEGQRTVLAGRISFSLRADRRNIISVTIRGVTQRVAFPPGGVTAECSLVF